MTFTVTLSKSGRTFQVEPDEPILTAALRQGIGLPYGCKNGACGSCKGTVVSGEVEQRQHSSSALSNDEKTRGMALFCCATPCTDLEIDIREVAGVGDVRDYASIQAYLESLTFISHVSVVALTGGSIRFRLTTRGGAESLRRALSVNGPLQPAAPGDAGLLRFELRH